MVQKLGIGTDQQKKIEDVFQQHRLKLVDLDATLRKEEITLEPLMSAESPDEARTVAQIDKVAQARAELEKANARFLFAIRRVLTPDQWKKLQESSRPDWINSTIRRNSSRSNHVPCLVHTSTITCEHCAKFTRFINSPHTGHGI